MAPRLPPRGRPPGRLTVATLRPTTTDDDIPAFWAEDSTPFAADPPPAQPCRIVLRQIDDDAFSLQERLVVTWPPGPGGSTLVIEPASLTHTDLASIPSFFGWFARRHGRHTPAALVHDLLVGNGGGPVPPALPPAWRLSPEEADLRFRQLLLASGVPPVRSFLMWTAVVANTRWKTPRKRLGLVLWGVVAVIGSAAFVGGLVAGVPGAVAAGLVAPAIAAVLWGRQYLAGVVAGYSLWWALFGSVPGWVAYKVYELVEWVVYVARRRRLGGMDTPREPGAAPPVPYEAR